MVAIPQIGRRLTYRRLERRLMHQAVRQLLQAAPAVKVALQSEQMRKEKPFYETATPEEWIAAFTE